MLHQLVQGNYIALVGDSYVLTTKLFELAYYYPPTQRLPTEAMPEMRKLRTQESHGREPGHNLDALDRTLGLIAKRGFEAVPSGQVKGLY